MKLGGAPWTHSMPSRAEICPGNEESAGKLLGTAKPIRTGGCDSRSRRRHGDEVERPRCPVPPPGGPARQGVHNWRGAQNWPWAQNWPGPRTGHGRGPRTGHEPPRTGHAPKSRRDRRQGRLDPISWITPIPQISAGLYFLASTSAWLLLPQGSSPAWQRHQPATVSPPRPNGSSRKARPGGSVSIGRT